MKNVVLKIKENQLIAKNTYRLILVGDLSNKTTYRPGSFVNLKIPGFYLRRPISICDINEKAVTLIYKVVGEGTLKLSKLKKGNIDVLLDMGNGYNLSPVKNTALLIGGGAGLSSVKLFKSNIKFGAPSEPIYDLRSIGGKNYVTQVKSQTGNTCCFAYSVISQAESYMIMNYPDYVNDSGFNVDATKNATSWASPTSLETLTNRTGEFDLSESFLAISTYKQPLDIYGNAGRSSAVPTSTWYNCGGAYADMPPMLLSTPRAIVADNSTLKGYFTSTSLPDDSTIDSYNDKVLAQAKAIRVNEYGVSNSFDFSIICLYNNSSER